MKNLSQQIANIFMSMTLLLMLNFMFIGNINATQSYDTEFKDCGADYSCFVTRCSPSPSGSCKISAQGFCDDCYSF